MKNRSYTKISLIYFISICLIAVIFLFGYMGFLNNEILSSFLIQIMVMFAVPMLLYTLFVSKNIKKTFKDTGFKKITPRMLIITIVLGFILYLLNLLVATFFSGVINIFGYERLSSPSPVVLNYSTLIKEFVLSCILPGICEEFLHRGIMLHANKKTGNPKFCLIISSILFGLMHLNINQFFYAAILGFLMGYVSLIADSIYPCIIIHFMNNFLGSFINYGSQLQWPIFTELNFLLNTLFTNVFTISLAVLIGIPALIYLYKLLLKQMLIEKTKRDMNSVVKSLDMNNIPIEEAQQKISLINRILMKSEGAKSAIGQHQNKKFTFTENLFIIASIILGALITISSFIWGVI